MNTNIDWKQFTKKAALQGVSLTAELFNDVAVELNKLASSMESCQTATDSEPEANPADVIDAEAS
jgi:hypothetical protein